MLLPPDSDLRVDGIYQQEEVLVVLVSSTACQSVCHCCGVPSGRVHSHYHRHPRDVPLAGNTVQLDVCVRRFFCDNLQCQATTFGEHMPELIAPHAHRTTRLAHQQQQVALESGGEADVVLGFEIPSKSLRAIYRNASKKEHDIHLKIIGSGFFDSDKGVLKANFEKSQKIAFSQWKKWYNSLPKDSLSAVP